MAGGRRGPGDRPSSYVRACALLERAGRPLGISASREEARGRDAPGHARDGTKDLAGQLELGCTPCSSHAVAAAAKSAAAFSALGGAACIALAILLLSPTHQAAVAVAALACPPLAHQAVISYPATAARKRASELLKSAADSVNLMVMGVRQDSSLPRAISFASDRRTPFASELRRCVWEVVTGTHSGFEEALHALGSRWEGFSSELKTALNSIVVASHEATEEGRRRALERANRALVSGAKRRVEEYALSLSAPSMILFGLGILLPIMVGSFMPMLSWDLWSGALPDGATDGQGDLSLETAMVMDAVFPAVAAFVALDAVSRRPVEGRRKATADGRLTVPMAALAVGVLGAASAALVLGTGAGAPAVLLAGTLPASALLALSHRRLKGPTTAPEDEVQDLLFRTGAGMLDGDNFESALNRASTGAPRGKGSLGRRLCIGAFVMGKGFERAVDSEARGERVNALEALKVVGRASTKDEAAAGMLAMDLASYLRELSEIQSTLKMRLRPTISMMRMTAHVLGPVVLGVTFAIYVSLGAVAGGLGDAGIAGPMLLVLGLFLAEMNAVVCYFVWGIEGAGDGRSLARSVGACIAVSQLVFVSTALVAA